MFTVDYEFSSARLVSASSAVNSGSINPIAVASYSIGPDRTHGPFKTLVLLAIVFSITSRYSARRCAPVLLATFTKASQQFLQVTLPRADGRCWPRKAIRAYYFAAIQVEADTREPEMLEVTPLKKIWVGGSMRNLALALACLSLAAASCGDDLRVNLDAAPAPDAAVGEGGVLPDGGGGGCPGATFLSPAMGVALTAADDKDGDACANGFQVDVQLSVAAPDGTPVTLLVNNAVAAGPVLVSGAIAAFPNVQIGSQGASSLLAQIGIAGCTATATYNVDCGVPTCSITKPVLTPTKTKLNQTDGSSAAGGTFQVAFEVQTDLPDGRPVLLNVARKDSANVESTVRANVSAGKATLDALLSPLNPVSTDPNVPTQDTTFVVYATCTDANGVSGVSAKSEYVVDVTPPALTITEPLDDAYYPPSVLMQTGGKFKVCGTTTSPDAVAIGNNFCAGIGTDSKVCQPIEQGTAKGCVDIECAGGAPFEINTEIRDNAGNVQTAKITGVRCASENPSVSIVTPIGDTAFTDPALRVLAASSSNELKDLDPAKTGAQVKVVACSDKPGMAVLKAGAVDQDPLSPVADAESKVLEMNGATMGCPAGKPYAVVWDAVTIRESSYQLDVGTGNVVLDQATRLRVEVTDASGTTGASGPVDIWVDSVNPALTLFSPSDLCTKLWRPTDVVNTQFSSPEVRSISLSVGSTPQTQTGYTGVVAFFDGLSFPAGQTLITATAVDPAGNSASFSCQVSSGDAPIVTWNVPKVGNRLCAVGNTSTDCLPDEDAGTPGWQGKLSVAVSLESGPATSGTVTFTLGADTLGVAAIVGGAATTPNSVTVPDGVSVKLTATTDPFPTVGQGTSDLFVTGITTVPTAIAELTPTVDKHRKPSFLLSWSAPADGSGAKVKDYELKYSTSAINDGNFGSIAGTKIFTATAPPGSPETYVVDDSAFLKIATPTYFALRARDELGNAGPVVYGGPIQADFKSYEIAAPADAPLFGGFGTAIDGSGDLNGDGRADLVVGTSSNGVGKVYIYFGRSHGADGSVTPFKDTPDVVITGSTGTFFGRNLAILGNVDNSADNIADLAIVEPSLGNIYIYSGRANWNASYTIAESSYSHKFTATGLNSLFGLGLTGIGDFNADGVPDFAVGAPGYASNQGRVIVVRGNGGTHNGAPITWAIDNQLDVANSYTQFIEGPDPSGRFGTQIVALPSFYPTPGTTLVVSAPNFDGLKGKLYAYRGNEVLPTDTFVNVDAYQMGGGRLSVLGAPAGGTSGVLAGPRNVNIPGYALGFYSDPAFGLFGGRTVSFINPGPSNGADIFGWITATSAFSGRSTSVNLIGGSMADVVLAGQTEGGLAPVAIYVFDPSSLPAATASSSSQVNVATSGTALKLTLPADFGKLTSGSVTRDTNLDSFGNIVVSEATTASTRGRLRVFW